MPGDEIAIRAAGAADSKRIAALATQVYLDTYATDGVWNTIADEINEYFSVAAIEQSIATPHRHYAIAERADRLLGFVQYRFESPQPLLAATCPFEIERLYVQPAQAGSGLGTALMRFAEAHATRLGCDAVWLTAWSGNARALAYYPRRGFSDIGTAYYEYAGERYENRVFAKTLTK